MIDERTERLINRMLDGELTEADELELNKQLIRSPEARRMLEDLERLDTLADQALHAAFERPHHPHESAPGHRLQTKDYRLLRRTTAVAAAILLAAMIGGLPREWLTAPGPGEITQSPNHPITESGLRPSDYSLQTTDYGLQPIDGPRRQWNNRQRDLIAVYDETTKSYYLLERDRVQRAVTPVTANY